MCEVIVPDEGIHDHLEPDHRTLDVPGTRRWITSLLADLRRRIGGPAEDLSHRWARLGAAQIHLGRLTGRPASFMAALQSFETALELLPRRGRRTRRAELQEARATAHFALGMATSADDEEQFRFSAAAEALSAALASTSSKDDPDAWRRRNKQLGETLFLLHAENESPAGVHASALAFRRALNTFSGDDDSPERAELLGQLAKALAFQASICGELADLSRAAKTARTAVKLLRSRNAPMTRAGLKADLAAILADQGNVSGDGQYIREAILCLRSAIRSDPVSNPWTLGERQRRLAQSLYDLGDLEMRPCFLQAAAVGFRRSSEAFALAGANDDKLHSEMNLGFTLQTLGENTARRDVMVEAVKINADVARRASKRRNPALWAKTQLAHALALQTLAEQDASRKLFLQAISVLEKGQAALNGQTDIDDWATFEHNRASILSKFGDMLGEPEAIRRAISSFEAALEIPSEGEDHAQTLNGLAVARQRLGVMMADRRILEEAAKDYDRQAEMLLDQGLPAGVPRALNNKGTVLGALGELTGEAHYLDRAIREFRRALKGYPRRRSPTDWAMVQLNLGGALMGAGELLRSRDHLERALACFDSALEVYRPERSPQEYANAMHNRGRTLLGLAVHRRDPKLRMAAVRAFRAALQMFEESDAEAQVQDTSAYLAQALMGLEDFGGAESVLRKTLARSTVALNSPRRSADSRDFALDQVGGLHSLLSLCLLKRLKPDIMSAFRAAEDGRARLLRKAIDDIQDRTGTMRRATDPRIAVPEEGAIVAPVLTRHGSFAFIVTKDHGLTLLDGEFKRFTLGQVQTKVRSWLSGYEETVGSPSFRRSEGPDSPYVRWNSLIADTMRWLWDAFLEPVDRYLRDVAKLAPGAEIVLLPASPMNLFPLQAAGPGDGEPSFGDLWTVSIAPSIEVLVACQNRARVASARPVKMLAVVGSSKNLRLARADVEFIEHRFAKLSPLVMHEGKARLAEVRAALASATHIHVSTHGRHDPEAPRQSTLDLADGPATVLDLGGSLLDQLRLVYLSACETGLAGVKRLDQEFLGLTSGFLQAGAPCVIASLWKVYDDVAHLLARRFYELYLAEDGKQLAPPAVALRQAQAWLRELTRAEAADLLWRHRSETVPAALRFDQSELPDQESAADIDRPFAAFHEWAGFIVTGT